MHKSNKININVNKDDQNINDFLYVWSELGKRPSRTILYRNYTKELYTDLITKKISEVSIHQDIIPLDEDDIVNERYFGRLDTNTWITFVFYDVKSDESFIGELSFHYDHNSSDIVKNFIQEFQEYELKDEFEVGNNDLNLFSVYVGQNGFDIEGLDLGKMDFDNLEFYYNDNLLRQIKKFSKKLKSSPKGLHIFYGDRGTGKTSVIKFLSSNIKNKKFIFIPTTLFDTSINNPDFRLFLKKHSDSVIILDDCELYFSDIYSKSNIFTNNLLQIVDGIDSDLLKINLLLILNCQKENEIDNHLLESNNLNTLINFDHLTKLKVSELCKHLDKKNKYKTSAKLVDVLNSRPNMSQEPDIGF